MYENIIYKLMYQEQPRRQIDAGGPGSMSETQPSPNTSSLPNRFSKAGDEEVPYEA